MQPTHATSDMPWAEARVGKDRILGAYAWRTMLDHHIPLAFGSDFPVEDVGPLLGIYAAVTRQDAAGNPPGGWYPAQRMTLDEAIAAFTRDAATAEGDDTRGVIATARGKRHDFVSRFFAPSMGVPEDPVTGSAHCTLIPYWAKRLGKTRLTARQVSVRGGELYCEDRGERVTIAGRAVQYLEGMIEV